MRVPDVVKVKAMGKGWESYFRPAEKGLPGRVPQI